MVEEISKLNITSKLESLGWTCVTEDDLHLGHISGLLKLAQIASKNDKYVKILLDDSEYGLKRNAVKMAERSEKLKNELRKILENLNMKNISFFTTSELRNNEDYVNDFYKLISVTPEQDALFCLDKTEDVKMADLLIPVIKTLDFIYLEVPSAVYNNEKFINLGKNIISVIKNENKKEVDFFINGTILSSKGSRMSSCDKMGSIWLKDTEKSINKKISKYFCEEGNVDCKIFDIFGFVVFPFFEIFNKKVEISTPTGEVFIFDNVEDLKFRFGDKKIHPGDLKNSCGKYLCDIFKFLLNL